MVVVVETIKGDGGDSVVQVGDGSGLTITAPGGGGASLINGGVVTNALIEGTDAGNFGTVVDKGAVGGSMVLLLDHFTLKIIQITQVLVVRVALLLVHWVQMMELMVFIVIFRIFLVPITSHSLTGSGSIDIDLLINSHLLVLLLLEHKV